MRRALFVLSLALIVAVPASQRAAACGNKFLRTGVGILQNHYAPNSSASVLVFARSSSGKASLLGDQNFQPRSDGWDTRWSSFTTKRASVAR